jgi:hypothetical protein
MKNKMMALGVACIICLQLQAQNTIPSKTTFVPPTVQVKTTTVSAVSIVQDSVTTTAHAGKPDTNVYHFKGTITSTGTGTINYKWAIVNTTTANIPPAYKTGSVTPGGAGTDNVFVDMGNGGNGYSKITLVIISPTQITSNSITY